MKIKLTRWVILIFCFTPLVIASCLLYWKQQPFKLYWVNNWGFFCLQLTMICFILHILQQITVHGGHFLHFRCISQYHFFERIYYWNGLPDTSECPRVCMFCFWSFCSHYFNCSLLFHNKKGINRKALLLGSVFFFCTVLWSFYI